MLGISYDYIIGSGTFEGHSQVTPVYNTKLQCTSAEHCAIVVRLLECSTHGRVSNFVIVNLIYAIFNAGKYIILIVQFNNCKRFHPTALWKRHMKFNMRFLNDPLTRRKMCKYIKIIVKFSPMGRLCHLINICTENNL